MHELRDDMGPRRACQPLRGRAPVCQPRVACAGRRVLKGVVAGGWVLARRSPGGVHARFMRSVPRGAADLTLTEDNGSVSSGAVCLVAVKLETTPSSTSLGSINFLMKDSPNRAFDANGIVYGFPFQ